VKRRPLALLLGLGLIGALLVRGVGRGQGAARDALPRPMAPAATSIESDSPPPEPSRNVFRYADDDAERSAARTTVSRVPPRLLPAPAATPFPVPLRLVGFVERSDKRRAALATAEGVVLVEPGDVVDGYTVLSVDEDQGLRVRAPDGRELVLGPPD
jgi:hypothetical protein